MVHLISYLEREVDWIMFENQSIQPDQILPENQDTDILEIAAEPFHGHGCGRTVGRRKPGALCSG